MTNSEAPRALPDSISQLIKLLSEERKNFTSVEIAETLWLAMQIEPAAEFVRDQPLPPLPPDRDGGIAPPSPSPPPPPPPPPLPEPKVNIAATIPEVGVLPAQTLPVWVADPAMLTDSLSIIRALKPLLQKIAVGTGKRLDEAATVENIARTRLWLPILKPEQEPWFDIVLVVDRGSSMHIWQRLVRDVVRILRCYGAFRDVQVFDLKINPTTSATTTSATKRQAVQLISKPHRPGHAPSEVIDQRGRRIVIVLSDCAGSYWWDGTLLPMLQAWGKVMPTVVWQMLPAWMWQRTALGRGTAVAMSNDIPGVENQRLKMRIQARTVPEDADQRIVVPVVTSEVLDLARWSLMVAGDRREITPGFLLPQQGGTIPRSKKMEEIARDRAQQAIGSGSDIAPDAAFIQALETIARERVQRFIELASPQAQRLIMLLAAAPVITLPVVRLIRDAMLSEVPSPLPLAEVFLSGLLLRLEGQEDRDLEQALEVERDRMEAQRDQPDHVREADSELDSEQRDRQDLVQYDFAPRVRNILLAVLPAVDTIEVINSVSAAVERRWNQFSNEDFQAFLTNPNVEVSDELAGLRSFASVTAEILEQLGGEYADFAQRLRHGSGDNPLPEEPGGNEDDFPLEDLEYEVAKFINFPPLQTCEYESATITAILDRFDFETAIIGRQNPLLEFRSKWVIQRRDASAWGYTETLSTETDVEIGLDMIAIPGGSFTMGAPQDEPESGNSERPQHEVTLQPFYLGRYTVTQAQWRSVAGYPRINRNLAQDPSSFKGANLPVENVSWEDAQEFCQRLSAQTGKDYRLPSEAEWEYACRAGTTTPFHYGETITVDLANYNGDYIYNDGPKGKARLQTSEVGTFPANDWGLHDMHGNMLEWCEDDYHSDYDGAPIDGSAWVKVDRKLSNRLLRGGSWLYPPGHCCSALRLNDPRGFRHYHVGFRVSCLSAKENPRHLSASALSPFFS
jgi:formylglycine-generating enzyme required for sulfatase activity